MADTYIRVGGLSRYENRIGLWLASLEAAGVRPQERLITHAIEAGTRAVPPRTVGEGVSFELDFDHHAATAALASWGKGRPCAR